MKSGLSQSKIAPREGPGVNCVFLDKHALFWTNCDKRRCDLRVNEHTANSSRMPPSRPRASPRSRASEPHFFVLAEGSVIWRFDERRNYGLVDRSLLPSSAKPFLGISCSFSNGIVRCVAIDPTDVGELQKALNDAAGKASVLWTTFVVFQLYLAITFGSVTHRDLFLETPIKLPLLNVDLPLVGFFAVARLRQTACNRRNET